MDGNAIVFGLGSSPGPGWLKDVIPTLGQRLKVHNDLKVLVNSQVSLGVITCSINPTNYIPYS